MNNMITGSEILAKVHIPFYTLDYLVKSGKVECIQRGKGVPRLYPHNTIAIINSLGAAKTKEAKNASQQTNESIHDAS